MGTQKLIQKPQTTEKMDAKFHGAEILDKSGNRVDAASLNSKDFVLIYFSAHWCPPCRGFTPVLIEWYKEAMAAGKNVEIVFVSSDKDEGAWKSYWDSMPWLSVKFGDSQVQTIKQENSVSGIPKLSVYRGNGSVAKDNGRSDVASSGLAAIEAWA